MAEITSIELVKRLEDCAKHKNGPPVLLRQAAARISVLEGEREKASQSQPCGIAASQPDAGLDAEPSGAGDVVSAARDLVALWANQRIADLPRSERNAAIEATRERLISAIGALDG